MDRSKAPKFLTQDQSTQRYNAIKYGSVNYHLLLVLKKGTEFSGINEITFTLNDATSDLFLDYSGESISKIYINERLVGKQGELYSNLWNGQFIKLPLQYLQTGRNLVQIEFSSKYSRDGNGLHSFIDTDGK